LEPAKGTRAGSRARRKIFSCPVCDEVFVDEESLQRHELTHKDPDAGGGEPEAPAAEETPEASSEASGEGAPAAEPEARVPRRSLSSVRRQAQQQQATQVEAAPNFLDSATAAVEMPVDPDATVAVPHPELAPLGSLPIPQSSGSGFGLGRVWGFVEDFSEWFVRGIQSAVGTLGTSVVSGIGLGIRALLVLAMAGLCVYAGTWFGRTYGPRVWGNPPQPPVIPPQRIVTNSPEQAKQAVTDLVLSFYSSLNNREYKKAYSDLSPAWQKALSFTNFQSGYSNSTQARCDIKGVRSLSGGRYQVDFTLQVLEKGAQKRYTGSYIAIQTPAGWKLDEGNIR
jgi:hypothetical protein